MKKLLFIFIFIIASVNVFSQTLLKRDLTIEKADPILYLNGLNGIIKIDGSTSGTSTLKPPSIAGTTTITLPASTGTLMTETEIQDEIGDSLTARIGAGVEISDIAAMQVDSLIKWVTVSQLLDSLSTGTINSAAVATQINDTVTARLAVAVEGIRLVDSTGNAVGNYVTRKALNDSIIANLGITASDTASMLSPYILSSEVTDTYLETSDTTTMLSPYFTEEEIRVVDSDTTTLFVFGTGSGGLEVDTALFTTSNIYGSFFNSGSDTLIITSLRAVMIAGTTPKGTDTLAIQVYWNDTINVALGNSYTVLNTSALGINSTSIGTVDTSFDNNAIPPNRWVWCKSPGVVVGRKPKALIVNLTGYKRNRSY